MRPAVGPNAARPGGLATSGALARDAELYANAELPEKARIDALINSIVRVLNSSGQCTEEDLGARLVGVGVVYSEEDLDVALGRLTDSGRLMLLKPKPTVECPEPSQVLVMANLGAGFAQSSDAFNVTDGLAADVHGCIKRRGDRFESDEQLETWLAEDSVLWSGHELSDAVQQLEVAGWLTRPHREREWSSGPLPGFLVSPSWARGWY